MPSTSKKQAKLMAAVAHNPAFAKKVGIPQSVGKEFNKADKGRKFGRGGDMAKDMSFAEQVEADNRAAKKEADKKANKYRAEAMTENKKKGGKVGMHRMPDGKMMKDSAHKKPMKKMGGGSVKYSGGGSCRGAGAATKGTKFSGVF